MRGDVDDRKAVALNELDGGVAVIHDLHTDEAVLGREVERRVRPGGDECQLLLGLVDETTRSKVNIQPSRSSITRWSPFSTW